MHFIDCMTVGIGIPRLRRLHVNHQLGGLRGLAVVRHGFTRITLGLQWGWHQITVSGQ